MATWKARNKKMLYKCFLIMGFFFFFEDFHRVRTFNYKFYKKARGKAAVMPKTTLLTFHWEIKLCKFTLKRSLDLEKMWSRECQFGRMVINKRWWQTAMFRAGERSLVRATGVGVKLSSSLTSGLLMGSINYVKDRAHSMLIKFADVTNLEAVAHTRRLRINTNGSNEITNTQRKEDN